MPAPLSVVIAAKNEAARIGACIASVAGLASEVVVVENDSTDGTGIVAAEAGATVFTHPFETIGLQRNVAIERARYEWILVLDADERCSPELAEEIRALLLEAPAAEAYRVPRTNFFLGRHIAHGGWGSDRPVRLFRATLRYNDSRVHERVATLGEPGRLRHAILHEPYATLDQYFEKFTRYSAWWAADQFERGRRVSPVAALIKPPARFVSMFVLRAGWLDGAAGLVLAVLAAMSVGAKYARLWALGLREPED